MLLPSKASEHSHGGRPCPGGRFNRDTAEFVYYMAHIENAAKIIKWGLFAHHWADRLPDKERRVIANSSVMERFGRRKHRKFANLYFGTHTAMQHMLTMGNSRVLDEKDMVFLRFNSDELFVTEGTKFSDGNVARTETTVYFADEDSMKLKGLSWNIILCQKSSYKGEKLKRLKMAELLVPHYIPPSYIHSAVVLNSESEEKLISLIKEEVSEEYLEALDEIIYDSDFDPPFDEDEITHEHDEVDIIRDGGGRHFFGEGDGNGGYNADSEGGLRLTGFSNLFESDPEDYF